ncbi:unnamed protein product [Closterium sp. NIES-53]
MLLCSRPSHVPPPPVLPDPPQSSLIVSSPSFSDFLCDARPTVSRLLSSLVINPTAPSPSVSTFVAAVTEFASAHRLDYATKSNSASACPPSVEGAPALGKNVLEDMQFKLAFFAAAALHFLPCC